MNLVEWLTAQSYGMKLTVGLSVGLFLYLLLKLFIRWINKNAKEMGVAPSNKRMSEQAKFRRLMALSQD
jgi:hypothetical protein